MMNRSGIMRLETRSRAKDDVKRVMLSVERVRKWEKKWVNVGPSSCTLKVYKWVPVSQDQIKREEKAKGKKQANSNNGEGYRDEPSIGQTNDSAASSPSLALPHTNKTLASGTNLSSKFPVNPLQVNTAGTIPGDSSGHPTNTSPIKRRASQAEELLKAQDAGVNFDGSDKGSISIDDNSCSAFDMNEDSNLTSINDGNNDENEVDNSYASNDDDDNDDNDMEDDDNDEENNEDDTGVDDAQNGFEGDESNMVPSLGSDESATISYRLGIGMVPDDEDSQDFDVATESSLQPVTDLAGVGDDPSNDIEGLSSQMTTDITSVLDKDCNPEGSGSPPLKRYRTDSH
ncbi:B-cell CLL/lymphoma 7 protein family member A-like isoform X2 [Montipora capricornis]|uniref:B-cell CLL/lymphoma 7 protein family member A-like isoform X2 n=1 Tax=Montipora foliosa TaxID=591990 RepID=UPI0035F1BA36